MAKQKFVHFVPRDKPPKLGPGRHKKNLNKSEKRMKKKSRYNCLLYTSPSPRDISGSRMPSSA